MRETIFRYGAPERRPPHRHFWGAYLFVPANRAGFLTRLPLLPVDAVILDLEYATRFEKKHEARWLAAEAIGYLRELRPDLNVTVRVNASSSGKLAERDLEIVAPARPCAIRIPAVEDAGDVARLCDRLSDIERRSGIPEGSTRLHPMIESPRGLANASAIARASARSEALCLGGEDWAHNVGAVRTRAGHELDYVRSSIVAVAAEHRLIPIDTVYNWLDDLEGLAEDCRRSRALGFRGRATIHPRQLPILREAYRPGPELVQKAKKMLDVVASTPLDGATIHLVDGVVTDPSALFQAELTCLAAGEAS